MGTTTVIYHSRVPPQAGKREDEEDLALHLQFVARKPFPYHLVNEAHQSETCKYLSCQDAWIMSIGNNSVMKSSRLQVLLTAL